MKTRNVTRALAAAGIGALVLHGWRWALKLYGPFPGYRLNLPRIRAIDSAEFAEYLSVVTDAQIQRDTQISVLDNGDKFYPAQFEAIRNASKTINLESYEFLEGSVSAQLIGLLSERARSGVQVRVVVDSVGSLHTHRSSFGELTASGGRVAWYHPLDWTHWPYMNQRTHRKLLIVDGDRGFIGGAGIGDHWARETQAGPRWRDTVFQVRGSAVKALNAVFAENWLESTGEILGGEGDFPGGSLEANSLSMIVNSTPGGATRARILYQVLLESARSRIRITTPYFVPDESARRTLIRAVRDRKVQVQILMAGPHSDHPATRRLSRLLSAKLAENGAEVFEYQPSMIHAKLMTVDGVWTVAGSTNFDHRSFDLNDEVNMAVRDRDLAKRVEEDFEHDLAASRLLTPGRIRNRSLPGRIAGHLSWLMRREQ